MASKIVIPPEITKYFQNCLSIICGIILALFLKNINMKFKNKRSEMPVKYNEATLQRPKGDRPLNSQLLLIDLPSFKKQIKEEKQWNNSDRNAITVYKTESMTIVLVAMHPNAEMCAKEGIVSIHILEGKVKVKTEEQSLEVGEEQVTVLHSDAAHSILALQESTFLLTVTS
jgi:quercetin dioxygenase-like cupin family protein